MTRSNHIALNESLDHLRRIAAQSLSWPDGPIAVHSLPGDASNRRYFRVVADHPLNTADTCSAILMQLSEPEAFKTSEEAVSHSSHQIDELPFLNIWRHFNSRGLSVPQVYHYDQQAGWLLLEDLGDRLLGHAVLNQPDETVYALYELAIKELVKLQTVATEPPDQRCLAFGRVFDEELFMWEFTHFIEYGIEARQGKPLTSSHKRSLQESFRPIAVELAALPRCMTHRDYHSRNLMLHRDRLWLLDFQDALLGPPHYDLASLLCDSYITLSDGMIDRLISEYLRAREAAGCAVVDPQSFRRLFDLMSLQRNLKAAGRFVYIASVKHNNCYLSSIPRTLNYVRANIDRYPELSSLGGLLAPLVPELATSLRSSTEQMANGMKNSIDGGGAPAGDTA